MYAIEEKSEIDSIISSPLAFEEEDEIEIESSTGNLDDEQPKIILLKLCMEIKELTKLAASYSIKFLSLPAFEIKPELGGKCLTFPMSINELRDAKKAMVFIEAFQMGEFSGAAQINFSKKIAEIAKTVDSGNVGVSSEQTVEISRSKKTIGKIKVRIQLQSIGETIVEEIEESPKELETTEDEPDPNQYDEYCADVNGYAMKVKILRKPSKGKKAQESCCDCDSPDSGTDSSKKVTKNGSQLLFQLPPNHGVCQTGSPKNVMMYNVKTCPNGDEHSHGNDKVKVLPGNNQQDQPSDSYSIKIGKRLNTEDSQGRFELELRAPKPIRPEEMKKITRDAETQTDKDAAKQKKKKAK